MKISFLLHEFPALSETFVLNRITGMIDRGHEVRLFADKPRYDRLLHPAVRDYELMGRTVYLRQQSPAAKIASGLAQHAPALYAAAKSLRQGWARAKGPREHAEVPREVRPLASSDWSPDVTYAFFGTNGLRALQLAERGWPLGKLVTSFHGRDLSADLVQHGSEAYCRLFEQAALLFPVCEFFSARLRGLGAPASKLHVVPSGIRVSDFPLRQAVHQMGEPIRLVTAGRLVEKKGIRYAIEALRYLVDWGCNPQLTIAGEGPLQRELLALGEQLGVARRILFVGAYTIGEFRALLAETHAFLGCYVQASDSDEDTVPNVMKEALATGVPVIASDRAAIPELIRDGDNGFLVPECDAASFAKRVRWLMEHPEPRLQMGKAGRQFVERHFNLDQINNQVERLLLDAITGQ